MNLTKNILVKKQLIIHMLYIYIYIYMRVDEHLYFCITPNGGRNLILSLFDCFISLFPSPVTTESHP